MEANASDTASLPATSAFQTPDADKHGVPGARDAWLPLPASEWNADAARHLLRRAAWSAQPAEVERAVSEGMHATLARLFPERAIPFPTPASFDRLRERTPMRQAKQRAATPEERRAIQKEQREHERQVFQDMAIRWLQFASRPELSAQEKWTFFLSDIYVVSFEKVRNPEYIHRHNAILRRYGLGPAPALAKAMSRSPALMRYLDLQTSKKDAPNENFARELFELFTLGEGHYTEQDIKQAARAFTGYGIDRSGKFAFNPKQHDAGSKTVFGHTGAFNGDDIVDLAFKQPAAAEFVPHEMARFYLTEEPLPREYLATLGQWWTANKHDLRALAHRFFGSRLFHALAFTGSYIKSPVQFYLGLVQDLRLDVAPIPRQTLNPLRQMGQSLFMPPNVRGWIGGRSWINSATLSARRALVQNLFTPLNPKSLNADEQRDLDAAREAGAAHFVIDRSRLQRFEKLPPAAIADTFLKTFLPGRPPPAYREKVIAYLKGNGKPAEQPIRIRNTAVTLLQSPEYQLC